MLVNDYYYYKERKIMWKKFAEEICDTLDRSVERLEKKCDNWQEFIDGKKELKDVISKNIEINLKGLNDSANILVKYGENLQYEHGKTRDLIIGDILGVTRGFYEHYGIYIGDGKIIHYYGESDTGNDNIITKTDFYEFLKGSSTFFIVDVDSLGLNCLENEEVITRAKENVGNRNYNLIFNNCEHFAFWCKTGKNIAFQKLSKNHRFYKMSTIYNNVIDKIGS